MIWLLYTVIAGTFLTVYLYYSIRSLSLSVHIYGQTPPAVLILIKLAWRILRREQGRLYSRNGDAIDHDGTKLDDSQDCKRISPSDDEIITISNYRVKETLLENYKQVSGDQDDKTDDIPLCFPESLFIRNLLLLVCKPQFRLSPLGLIHIGQTITQHEDLKALLDGPVLLETRTLEYQVVPRGVEVNIKMRIISEANRCVWSGVATLLSRSRHVQSSGSEPSITRLLSTDLEWDKDENSCTSVELNAAGNVGVKYALVSGDWNPHHLYPWSARLLGYRAPIAHGMWTLSKVMACIKESKIHVSTASFLQVEGKFKRPFFLPGTALLQFFSDSNVLRFRVVDKRTKAPHLIGSITSAAYIGTVMP